MFGVAAMPPRRAKLQRHPLVFLLCFILIVTAAIGGYYYWQHIRKFEETDDAFIDARQFALAPKVGGYIVDVPVTDNQHVEAGAILLRIDSRDYEAALQQAQGHLDGAQAQIVAAEAEIAAQDTKIKQAQAQVDQKRAALEFAEFDAKRYQDLAVTGAGTVQRSQRSSSDRQQRQADVTDAEASLLGAKLQVKIFEAQLKGARATAMQSKAQVDLAQLNLLFSTVRALQAGTVTKLSAAKGQLAQAGQAAMIFVPDEMWITANFRETQLTNMRPGQLVEFTIDAYPDRHIKGQIESIQRGSGTAFSLLPAENATGNYVKVVQRVPVKIVTNEWPADLAIGPGMSVVPKVRVR